MRSAAIILAGAALAAATPVVERQACASSAPAFQIQTVNVTGSSKRDLERRQGAGGSLTITLNNGILKDQNNRIGYIAANDQLQFDNPVQAGAKQQSGFAICSGNHLALNGNDKWYACLSGDFYNLYSTSQGGQCSQVYIEDLAGSSSGAATTSQGAVTQISDGQPQATSAKVSQISDGQPQAPSAKVSQISDGQIQAPTSTKAPVTQISDGQIQAPTSKAAITQISDGQIQAPTSKAAITQISDGQIQAPTSAPAKVSQISDGQPQAPKPTGAVSQIGDGQIQAPTNATTFRPTASVQPYINSAATAQSGVFGLVVAAFMAVFVL